MEAKRIRRVFREHRWILTTRQALDAGVHPVQLYALVQSGRVERLKRGLFRWAGAPFDEKYSLIVAHREVPDGVVCLLSALQFHDLTTQAPFEVWVTVKRGTAVPDNPAVPLRVFRSSGPAYREGIERHRLKGVTIKVYSVAKTVADCFKYRNKVGLRRCARSTARRLAPAQVPQLTN